MSAINIKELTDSITDEEVAQMARIERLIEANNYLKKDQESVQEVVQEIIEQRSEQLAEAGLQTDSLTTALEGLLSAYSELQKTAVETRFLVMKNGL